MAGDPALSYPNRWPFAWRGKYFVLEYDAPRPVQFTVSNAGVVTIHYGAHLGDDTFYLRSPNGLFWKVTTVGSTGVQTVSTGEDGFPFDKQLVSANHTTWHYTVDNSGVITVEAFL